MRARARSLSGKDALGAVGTRSPSRPISLMTTSLNGLTSTSFDFTGTSNRIVQLLIGRGGIGGGDPQRGALARFDVGEIVKAQVEVGVLLLGLDGFGRLVEARLAGAAARFLLKLRLILRYDAELFHEVAE